MKINEIVDKLARPLEENASAGATSSGAVATSIGGAAGFGNSVFMRRNPSTSKKKSKK